MARDRSPIVKQSRREGYALSPKAARIMVKRTTIPGVHGGGRQGKPTVYGIQLREKQKVRRLYGLLERQFSNLLKEASRGQGLAGENLLQLLERRMDNTVYRAGLAATRRGARQLVTHGHFMLNGKRVDIPSIRMKIGDEITVRPRSQKSQYFENIQDVLKESTQAPLSWQKFDSKKLHITVTGLPKREEAEPEINEQLIVEYYSR